MVNSFYIRRQMSGISTQFRNSSIIDEPITPFVDKKGESVKPSPLFVVQLALIILSQV
jgi:hypothetical protein